MAELLAKNMRARESDLAGEILLNAGNWVTNILEIPIKMLCQGDLIQDIFGDVSNQNQMTDLVNHEIFTSKNSEALGISNRVLKSRQGAKESIPV